MSSINYIVYRESDGCILRTGYCPRRDFLRQAHEGEMVMEGRAKDTKHKIADGHVVDKTQEEIEREKPARIASQEFVDITRAEWQALLKEVADLKALVIKGNER